MTEVHALRPSLIPPSFAHVEAQPQPAFAPSKPSLFPPLRVIQSGERLETTLNSMMLLHQSSIDHATEDLQKLQLEMAQSIRDKAQTTFWGEVWDTLKTVASAIFASLSAIFGVQMISSGTAVLAGASLLASGILSVTNLVFQKAGVWDWFAAQVAKEDKEFQEKLAKSLPGAIAIAAAVLGGAALASSWNLSAVLQKATSIAHTARNITEGVLEIGKGRTMARMYREESARVQLEKKLHLHEMSLQKKTEHLGAALDAQKSSDKHTATIIQLNDQIAKNYTIRG